MINKIDNISNKVFDDCGELLTFSTDAISSNSLLRDYISHVNSIPILTLEEEIRLTNEYLHTSSKAIANIIIKAHLRVVVKIAYQFSGYGISIMDLISEGNYGLIKAMEKFDPRKGFRFVTYAIWWIRAAIQEYIMKSYSMVKTKGINAYKRIFFNQSQEKRGNMMEGNTEVSTDVSLEFCDEKLSCNENIEEMIDSDTKIEQIKSAMMNLSDREKTIIYKRIISQNPSTLENLSTEMNISKERIRQIYEAAIGKIKLAIKK